MFAYLDLSERKAYDANLFCYSYKDISGKRVDITIQEDSQEFMNVIFDRLERHLEPSLFKGILNSVYRGKTESEYTCLNCQNKF